MVYGDSVETARREARYKSAYLARLLHYSQWKESDLPPEGEPVRIAIVGDDAHGFAQALLYLVNEMKVSLQGRPVKVFALARIPDSDKEDDVFKGCQVIYFLESEQKRWTECTLCHKKGVLAVGDGATYPRQGACVGFTHARNRIRLLVNREGYSTRDLKVSSRLLKLKGAVEIYEKKK